MLKFFRLLSPSSVVVRKSTVLNCCKERARTFADSAAPPPGPPPSPSPGSKQIVVHGSEKEPRVRVRRARPADAPRLLRFVRDHPRCAWPSFFTSSRAPSAAGAGASNIILADYVSRILAQGHSMLAEQIASRRGWLSVRGLALGAAVCPWDASMLERWASCLRCARTKRLVHFSAHCLRAPQLHDKYKVHNILQIILILPPETMKNAEIVQMLAKSAIQRGKEVGFPLLRFDVTDEAVAKALEGLNLTKEWHMSYDVLPEAMTEGKDSSPPVSDSELRGNFLAVYTAFTCPAAPEPKAEASTDAKAEAKPEAKTEAKTDAKTDGKTDGRTDVKTDGKTDVKTDGKTDVKTVGKTDGRTETTPPSDTTKLDKPPDPFPDKPKSTTSGL